jgi:hypothetical protein
MDRLLTKNEVQAQLEAKANEIAGRLDAIQREVLSAPESVRNAIYKNPKAGVGGAIAAGLLVGLLVGGRKKKHKRGRTGSSGDDALMDSYIQALMADVRKHVKSGAGADEAIQKALKNRAPIIVHTSQAQQEKSGFVRETFDLVFKTALGFAVKLGIDYLTARLNLEDLMAPLQSRGGVDAAAPIAAVMSDD